MCLRDQITERLELRGLSKEYLMVERGRAKFCMGTIYLVEEVSGREIINVTTPQMGRDEVLTSLGPRHSSTDLTNMSRVESRRLSKQALKRQKEMTDSGQNYTDV